MQSPRNGSERVVFAVRTYAIVVNNGIYVGIKADYRLVLGWNEGLEREYAIKYCLKETIVGRSARVDRNTFFVKFAIAPFAPNK